MSHVFEVVTYTTKNAEHALKLRRDAMEHAKELEGFVRYHALVNVEEQTQFVDLVEWASLEAAQAAAEKVMTLPAFQGMMAEIASVESMKHFSIDKITA